MNILSLLLSPFISGYNKTAQPKKYLVKYQISLGSWSASIEPSPKGVSDDTHVKAYLYFLERYFTIADSRQKQPMYELLSDFIEYSSGDYTSLMSKVEGMIYSTLNDGEKAELAKYVKMSGNVLPALLSDKPVQPKIGSYQFYLLKDSEGYKHQFFMTPGLDVVLLSRVVVLMLCFVDETIDKSNRKLLRTAIKNYLNEQ